MATRFTDEASAQLNPYFQQQEQAVQQQLPAIQKLYDTLLQGLEGQRATETQNILESASQRGVLRSTLPVDLQTQLGATLLGERGKLESQRAGDIANVNKSLADIGLQRTSAVSQLADALQQSDLRERQFQMQQQQAQQQYQLDQQRLQAETAARAGGGTRQLTPQQEVLNAFATFGKQKNATESVIIPMIMSAYGYSKQQAADLIYPLRKQVLGF